MIATIIILNTILVVALTTTIVSLMSWGILADRSERPVPRTRRRRSIARRLEYATA